MFYKKSKFYIYFFALSIPVLFFLKYLIINRKNVLINNLYFNLPILLNDKKSCKEYNKLIDKYLDKTISLSIIDDKGNIIAEHNPNQARVPASNLKLLSTAYVNSKYKNFETLKTELYKDYKNHYYLKGSADPDLNLNDIKKLINNIDNNKIINITLLEITKDNYWPNGWTYEDKLYKYGSPITQLAINSNASRYININSLKEYIYSYLKSKFPNAKVNIYVNNNINFYLGKTTLIDSIYSNTILSLVTLSNSESHNFTSESLFKNASNSWELNEYNKLFFWLRNKGLPMKNINISDASGLSRDNRLTTDLISTFLHKMKFNNNYEFYSSSLSIMGVRGTLANTLADSKLKGKFFGKTGTLSDVFSLSGYLNKKDQVYSLSIIQNSKLIKKNKIFNFLKELYNLESCI